MNRFSILPVVVLAAAAGCAHAPKPTTDQASSQVPRAEPAPKAPAPVAQVSRPAPVDPLAGVNESLEGTSLYFDFDSDQLRPESREALQRVSSVLRAHQSVTLKIEGNCDERGTEEYNLALGQRRAEAARKYLTTLGVPAQQLDTISYGALRPANPAHTEEAWQKNRRDVLHAQR